MPFSVPLQVAVTAWLVALAWIDFRTRRLPHWGTTLPLVGVAGYHAIRVIATWVSGVTNASAIADGISVGLAFLAVLLSDRWWALLPGAGALGLALAQGSASGQALVVTWLVALALARANVLGAGDAKLAMVLVGLFPDPRLAWLLLASAGVVSGLYLLVRHGPAAVLLVWQATRDLLRLRLPAEEDLDRGQPMAVAVTLAGVVYVWLLS
jgi:Flp pilus assembly protein protease CpaA